MLPPILTGDYSTARAGTAFDGEAFTESRVRSDRRPYNSSRACGRHVAYASVTYSANRYRIARSQCRGRHGARTWSRCRSEFP
jgi:hypothetical protein